MENSIKFGLPVYFIIYFGIIFLLKSIVVGKKIGKSPLVLPKDDSAFALVGLYFKVTIVGVFVYVLLFSVFPNLYESFLPIVVLEILWLKIMGIVLLISGFIWTIIAQNNMKNSWRIGIDANTKTKLIKNGLFQFSRNPVFVGLIASLVGLFLITPNAVTLLILVLGFVLIQIQIRLEEAFLHQQHGAYYQRYKEEVRRFI